MGADYRNREKDCRTKAETTHLVILLSLCFLLFVSGRVFLLLAAKRNPASKKIVVLAWYWVHTEQQESGGSGDEDTESVLQGIQPDSRLHRETLYIALSSSIVDSNEERRTYMVEACQIKSQQ